MPAGVSRRSSRDNDGTSRVLFPKNGDDMIARATVGWRHISSFQAIDPGKKLQDGSREECSPPKLPIGKVLHTLENLSRKRQIIVTQLGPLFESKAERGTEKFRVFAR